MKKTMKKLAALGLSLTMMMSLAACGNSASASVMPHDDSFMNIPEGFDDLPFA